MSINPRLTMFFVLLAAPVIVRGQSCQTWRNRTPQIFSRSYGKMVYDSRRGMSVLYGGIRGEYRGFDTETWEWDGAAWTLRGTWGPPARKNQAMTYDGGRGVTVLFSGSYYMQSALVNDTWEWDGHGWRQRIPAHSPPGRYDSSMTYDSARGVTVLFGGRSDAGELNDTWEWDGTDWTQRHPSTSPPKRWEHALVFDANRRVTVLFGGLDDSIGSYSDTWEWNGQDWTLASNVGPRDGGHAMAFDSARAVVVLFTSYYAITDPGSTWEWDGTVWVERTTNGPAARRGYTMAFDESRGATVMFGGTSSGDLWEWNGNNWTMRLGGVFSALPSPAFVPAMAFDSQRQVSVLLTKSTTDSETWEWDGNSWTRRAIGGPSARTGAAMAYDRARRVTVTFGGYGSDYLGDTWEWDGGSWTFRDVTGPPPRRGASMAYDTSRQVMVLFGGTNGSEFGDTWEWDGNLWTLRADSGPVPRFAHAMAFDESRHVTVMFGGGQGSFLGTIELNGTWEWDGSIWQQRIAPSPHGRYAHTLIYDSTRHVSILYGGEFFGPLDVPVSLSDTWEWDGNSWSEMGDQRPSARAGHAAAFDSARGVTVLFGGTGFPETWEYPCAAGCPFVADAPIPEGYAACNGCYAKKNRYISFTAPSLVPGTSSMALRVTLGPSPDPTTCQGSPDRRTLDSIDMWVGPEVLTSGGLPTGVYGLQPVPLFRDWSTVSGGIVHVSDCNIVPCAAYTVHALTDVVCDPMVFGGFSPALVLPTNSVWGDVVGSNDSQPGNQIVNISDVAAVVDCFREVPGAPPNTWCDLGAELPTQGVNLTPDISDVALAVDAFRGFSYPFSGPSAPATCH